MILIIGLGNPGEKYQNTRHNIGFTIIDELARKNDFPDFRFSKKFSGETGDGNISGEKIILAKPQTFMNASGQAAKFLIKYYKAKPENLFVIHDDIDLPLGKIRISKERGSAGHKGIESIINELKTNNFVRFRIGIDHKTHNIEYKIRNREKFVLQKFNKDEEKTLKEVIKTTIEAIETAISEGPEKAMNKFN